MPGTISAMIKRIPAQGSVTKRLWILHGGPGGSAIDDLDLLSFGLPEAVEGLEVYGIDHRGIGATQRLTCPAEDDGWISDLEWPGCIDHMVEKHGDSLAHLTTEASARDIGLLIGSMDDGTPTFVYGGSYGTYLASRYLHFFPDQAAGVILEGIEHPARGFIGYDQDMDRAVEGLFAECAADLECAAHFDGDPWETATGLGARIDAGHCAGAVTSDSLRLMLGTLSFYAGYREFIPALVHRVDRCSDVDAVVVDDLLGLFGMSPGNRGTGDSQALFFHVALSEMWFAPEDAPAYLDTVAEWRDLTASTGLETSLALCSFVLEFKGKGTVWLQTRNLGSFVSWIGPFFPG
jgi:pimeloyl-ACP methyl ester carboxylesterase